MEEVAGKSAGEYIKSAIWRAAFKEGIVHKPTPVLSLVLKKKYFIIMKSGEKKFEYRTNSVYWQRRMRDADSGAWHRFAFVDFFCGYQRGRPHFRAVCLGIDLVSKVSQTYSGGVRVTMPFKKRGYIRIALGRIVS